MTQLKTYGKIFYGLGIAGIGFMHFIYPGFRPIIWPIPPETTTDFAMAIYVFASLLMVTGLLVAAGIKTETLCIITGYVLLLFFFIGHLPNRLRHHPEISGYWIDAIKILALSGGAFVTAMAFRDDRTVPFLKSAGKIAPAGKYLFAFMLLFFSIGHFLNARAVSAMVPSWIPWPVFWTLLAGVALLGAGVAIVINIEVRFISLLLALVLFIWLVSLHLYYAFQFPSWRDGEHIMGSLECLAFIGIALLISSQDSKFTAKKASAFT